MKQSRRLATEIWTNPILVGTITVLVSLMTVYLSYIAENGLPFVPVYTVYADVQSAAELTKNADVRIGGARVGQVQKILAEPAGTDPGYPRPFARLKLTLQTDLDPLAYDTRYQVRLASVLGGKYLDLIPGQDRNTAGTPATPDGGVFTLGGPQSHSISVVDLDTALRTFDSRTATSIRTTTGELGNGFAGRGNQLNDAFVAMDRLIGPLDSLLALLSSPRTHLAQFVSGAAATAEAIAPLAPQVSSLLAAGAQTLTALQRSQLGAAIDGLPPTEAVATTVLTNARPVLAQAATLVAALKPGANLLPAAGRSLDEVVVAATPVFRRAPKLARVLARAVPAVDRVARDPAAVQTFKLLGSTDLATFGASAFVGLGAVLRDAAPGQFACNLEGIWARNFGGANSPLSEGDSTGSWLRSDSIIDPTTQSSTSPAPDLHINPYPQETPGHCEAGNMPYRSGQQIGNPPGFSGGVVPLTSPPPGVLARARAAGLAGTYR